MIGQREMVLVEGLSKRDATKVSGKGARNITVTLGFQPSAVLIYECYNGSSAEDAAGGCTFHYDSSMSRKIILEDDGFNVRTNYGDYPYTNRSGYTYVYMAFR